MSSARRGSASRSVGAAERLRRWVQWMAGRLGGASRTERRLRRDLIAGLMGDEAAADRLIAYERRRAPRASAEEHVRSALHRLQRDRR